MIGRRGELGLVVRELVSAEKGSGGVVVVHGDRGVGKTLFSEVVAARAREMGHVVAWGRGWEGGGPSCRPWSEVVRVCLKELGDLACSQALETEMLENLSDAGTDPISADELELVERVHCFLEVVSRDHPLLIVLDDLHWVPNSSLRLLRFVSQRVASLRCLVVGTVRSEVTRDSGNVADILGRLDQRTMHMRLSALGPDEVALWLSRELGTQPTEELAEAVYRRTGGIPFFVEKAMCQLRVQADTTGVPLSSNPIPPGIREEVIGYRLRGVSAPCRRVLAAASVLGTDFRVSELKLMYRRFQMSLGEEAAPGRGQDTDLDPAFDQAFQEAVAGHLFWSQGKDGGVYAFPCPMFREALYEDLPVNERLQLHRIAGLSLEQLSEPGSVLLHTRIAEHLLRADSIGGVAKVVRYSTLAARQDLLGGLPAAAVDVLERLLLFLDASDDVPDGAVVEKCRVLLLLSDANRRLGDRRAARLAAARAAHLARNLVAQGGEGADELFAEAALAYGADRPWSEAGLVDEALIALLEDALEALRSESEGLRARLLGRFAEEFMYSAIDSGTRRDALAQAGVESARRADDAHALAHALLSRHSAVWFSDNIGERLDLSLEAISLSRDLRRRDLEARAHLYRALDLLEAGSMVELGRELRFCADAAEGTREAGIAWHVDVVRAALATFEGRLEDASRDIEAALSNGRNLGREDAEMFYGVQYSALRRLQGGFEELEPLTRVFSEQNPTIPAWRIAVGNTLAHLGKRDEARREFEILASGDFAEPPDDWNRLSGLTLLAETCAILEDRERAATLYELLVPFADQNVTIVPGLASFGVVACPLGQLAALLERWDDAVGHFEHALKRNSEMGGTPYLAHTHLHYATMLSNRVSACPSSRLEAPSPGDLAARADASYDQAISLYKRLGMTWWANQAARLRHACREPSLGPRGGARSESLQAEALSPDAVAYSGQANVFKREGNRWTVVWRGRAAEIRDYVGARYLALLLRHPGQPIRATTLCALVEEDPPEPKIGIFEEGLRIAPWRDSGGTVADLDARAQYVRRLREIEEDLAEADANCDLGARQRLVLEKEALLAEVSRSYRPTGSDERARKRVWKNFRQRLLPRLRRVLPDLAQHLDTSVKTGVHCVYDPPADVEWTLD